MSNVYFKAVSAKADPGEVSAAAKELLDAFLTRENFPLEKKIPLKLHFGERGNFTYLRQENYAGIIDLLEQRGVECCFMETGTLYAGERNSRDKHLKLARDHGFTRLPVVIADGAHGEDATEVEVNLKHCRFCSLAKALANIPQALVLAHFKGHMLAGFGGAIKQISMGFASKGGKMAMHLGVKPRIRNYKCRRCGLCLTRCQRHAITIGPKSFIDHNLCIGCGACFSICPHHAISVLTFDGIANTLFHTRYFREKLVEFAFASHHDKRNIYMNFAVLVTAGCDCEPRPMRRCVDDIGVFISADPVAVDAACHDAVRQKGKKFKGYEQLVYAEKIGLGSLHYNLIEL